MKRKVLWLLILILAVATVSAVQIHHETASVSRIVGEDPDDMLSQLTSNDFAVQKAALFDTFDASTERELKNIFQTQFKSSDLTVDNQWNYIDVKNQLQDNKDNYIVLNPNGVPAAALTPQKTNNFKLSDISNWNLAKDNLFILDSKYGGLHLPDGSTFASMLSPKSTLIAPMSYSSGRFVKALACNIGKYGSIGKDFLIARNNYHLNTNNKNELIGLTLLSYELYGNPLRDITVPKESSTYCDDYDETFGLAQNTDYSITANNGEYTKDITVSVGSPSVVTIGDYELIEAGSTAPQLVPGEIMLPLVTDVVTFPANTIITNISLIGFSDSEDISADIPVWDGFTMQERVCYENTLADIEFLHSFTEQQQNVVAHIRPLDVVDCSKGTFKFYKTVKYRLTYVPYSPLLIKEVKHPAQMLPGQTVDIEIVVENLGTSAATGLFALSDDSVQTTLPVTTTKSSYKLPLVAPQEEGRYAYRVDFVQNGTSKTYSTFDIEVRVLDASLSIPDVVKTQADLVLTITNNLATSIDTTIEDFLTKDGTNIESNSQSIKLKPGVNTVPLVYKNLKRDQTGYDVLINIPYLGSHKEITGHLITNHQPHILQNNVVLNEGDVALIDPTATDLDGDTVAVKVKDAPFALDGSYTLTDEDSGEYPITIEASDGITTVEKTITLTVENVNRPPVLDVADTFTVAEGEELIIAATAADPDNENAVDNDDNELTITYSTPFDENGKWTPNFDESGEYVVVVTAFDGELSDTKEVVVTVGNTNRPPNIDDITDVTVNEGELVDLLKGYDPDNVNIDVSDDNIAHHSFDGPFDHYGKWQTTYDDAGVYEIAVSMTDYQNTVGKKVIVTVENVNRPPEITTGDVVEGTGTIDLSQYVVDPDNTNAVDNDDNILTITYSSPFDENGLWTVTQTSTALVTITVSDGEFTTTKDVLVFGEPDEVLEPEIPETPDVPEETSAPEPPLPPPPAPSAQPEEQPESTPPTSSPPALVQETSVDDLDVTIKANGKTLDDGDSIHVDPDDELTVTVKFDNRGTEDKDVDVDVDIDIDDEDDDLTVKAGDIERLTFDFDIPRLTDDDAYPFNVFVTDNEKQREWNFKLKIDKPVHELQFRYLTVTPERVQCADDTAEVRVKLENTGRHDEDGMLSIGDRTIGFSIEQGASRIFTHKLYRLEPGEHQIPVTVNYGRRELSKTLLLPVDSCTAEMTTITKSIPEEKTPVLTPKLAATAIRQEAEPVLPEFLNTTFLALATLFTVLFIFTVFTYK